MLVALLAVNLAAHASSGDEIRIEGAGSLTIQGFGAPEVRGRQRQRGYFMPTIQGECEIRNRSFGVRGRAGLGAGFFAFNAPPRLILDVGLMALGHAEPLRTDGSRYYGFEAGVSRGFAHTRLYGGPVLGTSRRWGSQMLGGTIGVRGTVGPAYELPSRRDWVTLSPGGAVGIQGGISIIFAPIE
jgi:hypothetical protein